MQRVKQDLRIRKAKPRLYIERAAESKKPKAEVTLHLIRPIELINIKEGDFDLPMGVVNVRYNKEKKPKIVPILDEDIELIKSLPRGLTGLYFFRHGKRKGINDIRRARFGKDYLYKWWKLACNNLGVVGVDLYGGTRHSSARALREHFSPEQIKKASMHSTNMAFERYFKLELDDVKNIYQKTKKENKKKGNIIKIDNINIY
jgi:integrase